MLDWKVGDKVVMVDGEAKLKEWSTFDEKLPQLNEVYTIRDIVPHTLTQIMCLRLFEIVNPPQEYLGEFTECLWPSAFFKKVQDGSKGLELLRGLLDPKNHNKYTVRDLKWDKKVKRPTKV